MARKNSSSDKDEQELKELIAQYEAMRVEGSGLYMDGDELADIADKYATERRFREAQEVITHGLGLHPGNTPLMIEQSYLYLDTQQLQQAQEVADSITEDYATEVKMLKAELLLNKGNLTAAEDILATIEDTDDLDTIIDISYLLMDMGFPEKALPWLTNDMEQYSEDEDYLAVIADCYCADNQLEKAAFFYNKLIDKNAYHPFYWLGLARCYFAEQKFDKALEAADFALAADEHFGEGHLMKAHCFYHLENEEEAIEEYQKAAKYKILSPEFSDMFIGLTHISKENWKQAEELFRRAGTIIEESEGPNSPILLDIYSNQALCLAKMGQSEQAHQLCARTQELSPNDAEPHLLEGRIYMEEENFDKSREQWGLALHKAPNAETWYQIGTYNIDCNQIENARFCFEQAMEMEPDMEGLPGQLASLCLILKDHKGFYKYNQLSEIPLNVEAIYESLQAMGSTGLIEEIKNFMEEVKGKNNKEEEEEEEENK